MNIVTLDDFDSVWDVFKKNKKYLGHVMSIKVKDRIEKGNVIFQDGVVITFHISKVSTKFGKDCDVSITKGDCILHQIASDEHSKGNGSKVLQEFFNFVDTNVYLGVLDDNDVANNFYVKNGMKKVGYINWSKGKLKGSVFKYSKKLSEIEDSWYI